MEQVHLSIIKKKIITLLLLYISSFIISSGSSTSPSSTKIVISSTVSVGRNAQYIMTLLQTHLLDISPHLGTSDQISRMHRHRSQNTHILEPVFNRKFPSSIKTATFWILIVQNFIFLMLRQIVFCQLNYIELYYNEYTHFTDGNNLLGGE